MKKIAMVLAGVGVSVLTVLPFGALAQSTVGASASNASSCVSLPISMRIGVTDATTGGLVTMLQNFLANQGYFNSAYIGTGRFGPMTFSAVTRYQAAHGLPSTGFVGPKTRAYIGSNCGVVPPPQQNVSLQTLSPSSGPVGTTVYITGFGFTNSNTIYMDSGVVAQNVPINSSIAVSCTNDPNCHGGIRQTLVFTIPSGIAPYCAPGMYCAMMLRQVTPGNYTITVQNSNGTSNGLTLSVTDTSGTQPLSINGIDAPSTLTIGQTGAWTVRTNSGWNAGTLHYSVVWGDENTLNNSIMAPQATSVQTTATFNHVYQISGTYTPRFTVTDDYGHSSSVSASVTVNPIY